MNDSNHALNYFVLIRSLYEVGTIVINVKSATYVSVTQAEEFDKTNHIEVEA